MSQEVRVQLTTLCAVLSFLWISHNFESHTLNQWPRFSVVLVLLLSSCFTWVASYFSAWLPGSDGRFDEKSSGLFDDSSPSLPRRPRRYFVPVIIACIVLRIEAFHQTTSQIQCSTPGIESFLCTLIVIYDVFFGRKPQAPTPDAWEPENPWREISADIRDWLKEARLTLVASVVLLSSGAFEAAGFTLKSTYFCSSHFDSRIWVLSMQLSGLFLDAVIAILLWRVLSWTQTTRGRLRSLARIQGITAVAVYTIYLLMRMQLLGSPVDGPLQVTSLMGVSWLYIFDTINDSFAVAVVIISTSLLVCETGPLKPIGVVTFVSGLVAAWRSVANLGSWHGAAKGSALGALYLLITGFAFFLYTVNIRSVLFLRRVFVLVLLLAVVLGMSTFTYTVNPTWKRHALSNVIFHTRTESDRWLMHASVSNTLHVAVSEYKERNDGRDPPPNFDKWFEFAMERNTPITDHFAQIRDDVAPFWNVKPGDLRQLSSVALAQEPDVAVLRIVGKKVTHSYEGNDEHRKPLDELVQIVQGFSEHLGDMELPINLSDEPRVLAPWAHVHQPSSSGIADNFHIVARRDGPEKDEKSIVDKESQNHEEDGKQGEEVQPASSGGFLSAASFREMEALTCPAGSPGRTVRHWNVRDLCLWCAEPHSAAQFLRDWEPSLGRCGQPDMSRLHGFHSSSKRHVPHQELVPFFSRHKADGFNDVLIPWPRAEDDGQDSNLDFHMRKNRLHWRGELSGSDGIGVGNVGGVDNGDYDMLRGNQRHRLLHLLRNATTSDELVMMLPAKSNAARFGYDRVRTTDANAAVPFDVDVTAYGSASEAESNAAAVDIFREEFGETNANAELDYKGDARDPERYRYVLLLDSNSAPPKEFLHAMRSSSTPFVASVFREWFSERLIPWAHFVPVDLRFQGLHSTLAYFTGIMQHTEKKKTNQEAKEEGSDNEHEHEQKEGGGDEKNEKEKRGVSGDVEAVSLAGRDILMEGEETDGRWIALEGRAWARRALRREDMEIYLFRLLLEWGRVVDDERDSLGFKMEEQK